MKHPSLVRRIIGSQILMMSLSWLVLVAWLLHTMTTFEDGDLDRRMKYFAEILAETSSGNAEDTGRLAQRLRATQKTYVEGVIETLENSESYEPTYQVFNADGALLYRTGLAPETPLTTYSGLSEAKRDGEQWRFARVQSSDRKMTVIVGERESDRWASILPMLRIIGTGQILILASALLITWWATRRGMAPLNLLAKRISERKAGDTAPISVPLVYQETWPMVQELNALLSRESCRLETERGFLADAAHELRTPLAAIAAQAHLLMGAEDATERQRLCHTLEAGLDRISHLLTQLLTIARADAMGMQFEIARTDIAVLLRDRLAELSALARARAITLSLECPETLQAMVNPAGFASIIDNLVDNAIRYTPSGGCVSVKLESEGREIAFVVCDNGPGIASAERDRVFERFYRIPGSTSQGSGLGLAIVQRIARAHDASVRFVEGIAGSGLGVVVRLAATLPTTPAAADSASFGKAHLSGHQA